MEEFYVDLGSSTIKVYSYEGSLKLLEEHSIYFKNNFDPDRGISEENESQLIEYFTAIQDKYKLDYTNTHIYVTGIFRELSPEAKKKFIKLFNDKFDLHLEIISHGIENYYLSKAMENDYNGKKVLIINMGGKTTELVTFKGKDIVGNKNLKIGVADLLNNFAKVNDEYSGNTVEEMTNFILDKLTDVEFDDDYDCAIFTGGEERFELLTKFNLEKNDLFDDGIHHYKVSLDDYIRGTEKVFNDISMDELYLLMPGNPKWMDGARSGAIIPLAIFKKARINCIIPSDLNLINGVIKDMK